MKRRSFLQAIAGLVAASSVPAAGNVVVGKLESENIALNVVKQWLPSHCAWIYEFSSKSSSNHYWYSELVGEEMDQARFEKFKEMALIQINKMKSMK